MIRWYYLCKKSFLKNGGNLINETDYNNNPLTKEQENQIDALFIRYNNTNTPGCAVGVIKDGRFVYKKCFGMANLDYCIPITADSRFELASVSKQFTAACIALLNLDGKLNFDDDVRKFIPELPDYGSVITIKHLLYHTSGLRDCSSILHLRGNSEKQHSKKETFDIIYRQMCLNFRPGEKYLYSNSGYVLLAEVVARISKNKFSEYIHDHIFSPLGMLNTIIDDGDQIVIKDRITGYHKNESKEYSRAIHYSDDIGGKGVLTSLNDLLLWDSNFYTGKIGGVKFIDLMCSEGFLNSNEKAHYGFGIRFYEHKKIPVKGHNGGYCGFATLYSRFPEQKMSIIVLNNNDALENYKVAGLMADILLNEEIAARTVTELVSPIVKTNKPISIQLTQQELEKFCGYYWCNEDRLNRKIYLKDGSLFYWRNEKSETKLFALSQFDLIMESKTAEILLNFEFSLNQKIIKFFKNSQCTSVLKSYEQIDCSLDYLINFTGNYYSEEFNVVYKLKIESGKLFILINGEQFSELEVISRNLFQIVKRDDNSTIKFYTNDKNEIINFKLDTERVRDVVFIPQ